MTSDYLTLEEVCELLGKTQTDVKRLVADGQLRELHDAGKVFYKRSEVERIAEKEGSSIVNLTPGDELTAEAVNVDDADTFASALSSLADSSSGLAILDESPGAADAPPAPPEEGAAADSSPPVELTAEMFPEELPSAPRGREVTSEIDLVPDLEESEPAAAAPSAAPVDLEVPDLGLSGSSIISLEPDLEEPVKAKAPPPKSRDEAKPAKGISVFDDDEIEISTDPMGETRISSGMDELEAVGSGSGLLDITQETDDTSLGAELLDVISPSPESAETETEGEVEVVESAETVEDSASVLEPQHDETEAEPAMAAAAAPAVRRAPAAAMTGAMPVNVTLILGVVAMAVIGLATAANVQGVWPAFMDMVAKGTLYVSVFGGLAAVAIGMGVWGILADRK